MQRFLKGLAIFFGLSGVGVISAFAVVALLLRQEEVRVPDLTGRDIVNTIEVLSEYDLRLKVEQRLPHVTLPKGRVISQKPPPGSGIKKGRPVRVVVSLGPSETQAPAVAGVHYRKAVVLVRQAGYFPGMVSRVPSKSVKRDVVMAQDPPAATPLKKGQKINLLVSAGKKASTYAMPRLIGRTGAEAVSIIDRMGLERRLIYRTAKSKMLTTERIVISQKPLPGYPVAAHESVELVVSK